MPFLAFFGATAVASGAGAVLHAMDPDRSDARRRSLWRLSLASIGAAALSSWFMAARLARPGRSAGAERAATLAHVPYLVIVATGDRPYWVAVACYLPGAGALGSVLAIRLDDPVHRGPAAFALAGLGVTFVAAGVQIRRIGFGAAFDHNALYHSLQAAGIALFYGSAIGFLVPSRAVVA